jgi:ABC-2 type transport system ATP-binding protein
LTAYAELRHVTKTFGAVAALRDVNLTVDRGDVVALLGANGAGKTTAIKILLGLRRPDGGHARVFDLDPRLPSARRRCGATPQETDLPETLRVTEILEFVRAHFERPLSTRHLLERFGLERLARRETGGLSGGERRRLAVALAFAGDPDLVFLDEPSSGLDVEARRALWESVRTFVAQGRSILLTTHDLREAEALATRVVVLERGRVALAGPTAEIRALAGQTCVHLRRQTLPQLRHAASASTNGNTVILLTADPAALVAELVSVGADLADIEIVQAGLEELLLSRAGQCD